MKGLEPSTFAMARRRSSQLSYIRVDGEYSQRLEQAAKVLRLLPECHCRLADAIRADIRPVYRWRRSRLSEEARAARKQGFRDGGRTPSRNLTTTLGNKKEAPPRRTAGQRNVLVRKGDPGSAGYLLEASWDAGDHERRIVGADGD